VEEGTRSNSRAKEVPPDADARLMEQIRAGDVEAGQQFVREHYSAIYRYLLYLTGKHDLAEDLTQEAFLQGWRYLETYRGRGTLRSWLLRIAHREFLHLLHRRRAELGLEEVAEMALPHATSWTECVELRNVIDRLPREQREVLLLHYLEGYSSAEIAQIVQAPAGTVRYRLAQAREQLRQELGEDDLSYLNEPLAPMRQWAWLPLDQMFALETHLARAGETREEPMERREFLRQATVGAAGLVLAESGQDVVDGRLAQKVSLAYKGTALADLCEHVRAETGVHLAAGSSVSDEKVTLFCEKLPLRDVMRQLSRPFGYTWLRSGKAGEYRYELVQDLRSQLLEEELRNRDRNEALLVLDREIERYRPLLGLSPDEALARSKTTTPAEKTLLENLSFLGWGPVQVYFRLSNHDQAALRAGQTLSFCADPRYGQPLAPELARGVLQSLRDRRLIKRDDSFHVTDDTSGDAMPLPSVPEARACVSLRIDPSELGQFTLEGSSGFTAGVHPERMDVGNNSPTGPLAVGRSPSVLQPGNSAVHSRLAGDPALRPRVTLQPESSCGFGGEDTPAKVTSADVLEALHRATGLPIVADHYTRLYATADVSVRNQTLFDALNHLADRMRLRWTRDTEGGWLQFRSASYFHDRLKEVPGRLLTRWAAARRQRGALTLDDLVEIAQLPDAQLDAEEMAEGAKACFGLMEWKMASNRQLRRHLRYLAGFTPAQRQEAMSSAGLAFTRMSLAQQQEFLAFALGSDADPLRSLDDLAGSVLRVEYTLPGEWEWKPRWGASWLQSVVPTTPGQRAPRPLVRARTRDEALQEARRLYAPLRESVLRAAHRTWPEATLEQLEPTEAHIVPTELGLTILYMPGAAHARAIQVVSASFDNTLSTWPGPMSRP
jgi:RNA polymerase sigma-70 factor, ECF subfamily